MNGGQRELTVPSGRWYSRILDGGAILNPGPDEAMLVDPPNLPPPDFECRMAGARYGPGRVDNPCDRYHFWSLHPTGANWLFADGSVRFLPYSARDIIPALATRAGGDIVALAD